MTQPDKNGNNYDRLQKITTLCHLRDIYVYSSMGELFSSNNIPN